MIGVNVIVALRREQAPNYWHQLNSGPQGRIAPQIIDFSEIFGPNGEFSPPSVVSVVVLNPP